MLKVEGLRVRYGEVDAVKGIDLDVPEGAIVALIGANGAGKSSTLAAIVGLVPSTGTITFEGRSIAGIAPEEIARQGIALTPEGRRIFANLTVEENLLLGGAAHGARHDRARTRARLLERFPILRQRLKQRAGLLSGGEQQMLAIARSLMAAPRLLLLDEPSLGLAPQIVDQVFALIEELREQGLTILLVEQNATRALEIATFGYVLMTGSVELEGTGAELSRSERVREAYLAA